MSVLILKNASSEGPGTIEVFLKNLNEPCKIVELGEGETPPPLDGYGSLIMLGGPMGVYEAEKYSFMKDGFKAIEGALKKDMKVLGVCLGAQAIAHVLGARVFKGHAQEVGWLDVELTSAGLQDPVMSALSEGGESSVKVFHWHGDTFSLPGGARRLARSDLYENQAFGYGTKVYGLQFHIEVTPQMIAQWFRGEPDEARVLEDTEKFHKACSRKASFLYEEFFVGQPAGTGRRIRTL